MDAASNSSDRGAAGRRTLPCPVTRTALLPALLLTGAVALLLAGAGGSVTVALAGPALYLHGDDACDHGLADATADASRLEGEHGLHVGITRDSLVVGWLTDGERPGRLEVTWQAGSPVTVLETPPGQVHRAAVRRTGRDATVLLRYGAANGAMHQTTVHTAAPRRPPVEFRGVDTLYVAGDTHGHLDDLVTGLRRAGLVGDSLQWTGGRKHLALAGDLVDRGPDVMALLWFIYRLEHEAARAGGRVHVVLGNHETMVMMGDLRYVHEKELGVAAAHGLPYDRLLDIRTTILGRWLVSKPAIIRIDRTLVVHGGVAPEFAALGLRQIDAQLARFSGSDMFYNWATQAGRDLPETREFRVMDDFFQHPRSVFWHRAYVQTDTAASELRSALRQLGADRMVVGHTPVQAIHARYDGAVVAAHTPRNGAELVMLVRAGRAVHRFRIVNDAAPEPF